MPAVARRLIAEDRQRDGIDRAIRIAVGAVFVVDGDKRFAVRRQAVHEIVGAFLRLGDVPPQLAVRINMVVAGMGARCVEAGRRRLFSGVRRRELTEDEALTEARLARGYGKDGKGGGRNPHTSAIVDLEWFESQLAAEGMPAELSPARLVDDARCTINRAHYDRVDRALWAGTVTNQVLALYAVGKSTRDIAQTLGVSKTWVNELLRVTLERDVPDDEDTRA